MLNVVPEEERAHGTISNKTYYIYLRQGASALVILLFVILFFFTEVSIQHLADIIINVSSMQINIVVADWWLSNW